MFRKSVAALMVSSAVWCSGAHAQTADEPVAGDDRVTGNEIIVTAQRRDERLADVPLSITAASGEQLKAQGVTSPADLEKIAPGFTFQRSSYGVPVYSIRGVGFLDTALGVPPTVSVYVDQVPIAFSAMTLGASLDLERVEILKGPQGTLYGQNSTGGLVNYIAAKPTSDFHAGGEVTVGRFSQVDVEGYVSGPITSTLRARLAVRSEQRGDWQESYTRDDSLGERHFSTGRFLLDWEPNDFGSFEFGLTGWRDTSDTQAAQFFGFEPTSNTIPEPAQVLTNYPLAPRDPRAADWNPALDGQLRNDNWYYQIYVRGNFELGPDTALSLISTFSDYKADYNVDPDGVTLRNIELNKYGKLQSFFNEARLSGGAGSRIAWMVGASIQADEIVDNEVAIPPFTASNAQPIPFLPRFISFRNNNTQKAEILAGFGSLDVKVTDTLTAQASARYTDQNRRFTGCGYDNGDGINALLANFLGSLVGVPQNAVAGGCYTFDPVRQERLPIYNLDLNEDNVSWRASLNWKPTADTLLYANVTKGYKAGSFPTVAAITLQEYIPARQEELLAYEAGFRAELIDRVVQVSGAVFRYDYRDKQVLGLFDNAVFGKRPVLTNIPESRVNGAEVQATLTPVGGLNVTAGATYVDSKVTAPFTALVNALGQQIDIEGEPFPNSPKWQLTADAQYDFPVGDGLNGFVGGSAYHRSSASAGFGRIPQFVIPAYTVLDLRAGVESDAGWRAEIWGRNVTNELYWNNIAKLADTFSRTTGMPATYGIRVSYDY